MYFKQEALQEVSASLKKTLGKGFMVTPDMLEVPRDPKLGDIAFPVFELAKGQGKNPAEVARELAAKIGPTKSVAKIVATGPYVNFWLNPTALAESVLAELKKQKAKYGQSQLGDGTKVIVDYAQPNTHKVFHIGHVRNAALGQAIINVLRAGGYEVVAASYIGDSGADVAKTIWGLEKFHKDEEFAKEERADKLQEIYTQATQYVAKHPKAKEEIAEVQRALENHEEPWHGLWKETREWSLESFREVFRELHIKPEVWYFESEVEEGGKKIVQKMLTDGLAKKSDGAVVVDLEDQDLGAFLVLKSDGSALYSTMDLELARRKQQDYDPDRQIFVVDVRQSLHFKQLFATLKKLGFTEQMTHVAYDMVTLPDGAMSSREGNIVTYRDLRDQMIERLASETQARHEDWPEAKITKTAHDLAIASLTFTMLRQDPKSIITFDLNEAMSFDGFTAPYILYTIARIESIKRKTKIKPKAEAKLLGHGLEIALLKNLAEYPFVIERAAQSFQVSLVAQWAFETAKQFSEYYHEVHVLDDEQNEQTAARLALIDSIRQVLTNAMTLLGIDVLEEM